MVNTDSDDKTLNMKRHSDVRLHTFQTGREYEDLPEVSNVENSEAAVPNVSINLDDSYARANDENNTDQVLQFVCLSVFTILYSVVNKKNCTIKQSLLCVYFILIN